MALSKAGTVLGFQTDIYAKITGVIIEESGGEGDMKTYLLKVCVSFYTDSTKAYSYKQEEFSFFDVPLTSLSIEGSYALLKTRDEFFGYTDA